MEINKAVNTRGETATTRLLILEMGNITLIVLQIIQADGFYGSFSRTSPSLNGSFLN